MSEGKKELFSPLEIDAIGEISNISLGSSATAVSNLLDRRVDITTPQVKVVRYDDLEFVEMEPAIGVEITYTGGLSGSNLMLLKKGDVREILEILMPGATSKEDFEVDDMALSAVCEVMNQMMGASATALAEFLGTTVNISPPESFEVEDSRLFKKKYFEGQDYMIVIKFRLSIEECMDSEFMTMMKPELGKQMIAPFGLPEEEDMESEEDESAMSNSAPDSAPRPDSTAAGADTSQSASSAPAGSDVSQSAGSASAGSDVSQSAGSASVGSDASQNRTVPAAGAAGGSSESAAASPVGGPSPSGAAPAAPSPGGSAASTASGGAGPDALCGGAQVQTPAPVAGAPAPLAAPYQAAAAPAPVQSAPAQPKVINVQPVQDSVPVTGASLTEEESSNLDMIMSVPLQVSVEIGRTRKPVREIMDFSNGTLVVLDKMAGDMVDIFVNGQQIAKGDVVVIDDSFGVRITEIFKDTKYKLG